VTDSRRQRFAPYLRDLADRMRRRDWTIDLKDGVPTDPQAAASIHLTYGRKLATIRVSDDFLDSTPETQRHYLVHELVHCHIDAAWMIAMDSIPQAVESAFKRMAEHAVDSLAETIAPLLPLPPIQKGGKSKR
jgi:hypothetical protein